MNLSNLNKAKVLIVGDIMLDQYWLGETARISPEAPVPIVNIQNMEHRLGGAANVAMNVYGLGASATLVGVVGNDENADKLFDWDECARSLAHAINGNLVCGVQLMKHGRNKSVISHPFAIYLCESKVGERYAIVL